jgi:hypothetical protein
MILYCLNLVLANTFGWGRSYGEGKLAVETGESLVTGSMPIVMALMMAPFILMITHRRNLFLLIWAVTTVAMLLVFKRTNIASLIVGYLALYTIYTSAKRKWMVKQRIRRKQKSMLPWIFFFILLFAGIGYVLYDVIIYQYEVRARKFEAGALEKEGRVIEWYLVKRAILDADKESVFLLGKEPYNTVNNYGFDTRRNIHGDFSMILFSTGVLGSILYWLMQVYIALLVLKYGKKRYLRKRTALLFFSSYLATSMIWFICCFSATLRYVLVTAVYYMIHGMVLRYFWNMERVQKK